LCSSSHREETPVTVPLAPDPDPVSDCAAPRLAPTADECDGCLIATCAPSCASQCCCSAATGRHRKARGSTAKEHFCLHQNYSNFRTFCNQTSLHGWQYIAQKHTSAWKHLFWFVIVLMSMGTASFFLYNNTVAFFDATVSTCPVAQNTVILRCNKY
jgi:hypothetical protein